MYSRGHKTRFFCPKSISRSIYHLTELLRAGLRPIEMTNVNKLIGCVRVCIPTIDSVYCSLDRANETTGTNTIKIV